MAAARRDPTPWIVTGAVGVVLFSGLGYLYLVRGSSADTVREVADLAAEAVQRFDVRAGGRLLCDPLTDEESERLELLVRTGKERADTEDPRLDIVISNVRGEDRGSFQVRVTSPEPGLVGVLGAATVLVAQEDGRACISGLEDEDYQGGLDPH